MYTLKSNIVRISKLKSQIPFQNSIFYTGQFHAYRKESYKCSISPLFLQDAIMSIRLPVNLKKIAGSGPLYLSYFGKHVYIRSI